VPAQRPVATDAARAVSGSDHRVVVRGARAGPAGRIARCARCRYPGSVSPVSVPPGSVSRGPDQAGHADGAGAGSRPHPITAARTHRTSGRCAPAAGARPAAAGCHRRPPGRTPRRCGRRRTPRPVRVVRAQRVPQHRPVGVRARQAGHERLPARARVRGAEDAAAVAGGHPVGVGFDREDVGGVAVPRVCGGGETGRGGQTRAEVRPVRAVVVAVVHAPVVSRIQPVRGCRIPCDLGDTPPELRAGSGRNTADTPASEGAQLFPPSVVRNTPLAETATVTARGSRGSVTAVCRHSPPPPDEQALAGHGEQYPGHAGHSHIIVARTLRPHDARVCILPLTVTTVMMSSQVAAAARSVRYDEASGSYPDAPARPADDGVCRATGGRSRPITRPGRTRCPEAGATVGPGGRAGARPDQTVPGRARARMPVTSAESGSVPKQ